MACPALANQEGWVLWKTDHNAEIQAVFKVNTQLTARGRFSQILDFAADSSADIALQGIGNNKSAKMEE